MHEQQLSEVWLLSMKHLTKPIRAICFLVLAFLMTIGTQVSAAETVMMCDGHQGDKNYYKLVNPLWGDRKMLSKNKGQWEDWCKTVAQEQKWMRLVSI